MIPDKITREHIFMAIKEIYSNGIPADREEAKSYLLFDGRKYPAKHVISIAGKYALGHEYRYKHFSGGVESSDFLKNKGFTIIQNTTDENKSLALLLNGRNDWYENIYLSFITHGRTWIRQTKPISDKCVKLFEDIIDENGYFLAFGCEQKPARKISYIFKIDKIFNNLKGHVQAPDSTAPSFYTKYYADQDKFNNLDDSQNISWLSVSHAEIISPMTPNEFTNYYTCNTLSIYNSAHIYVNVPDKYLYLCNNSANNEQQTTDNKLVSGLDTLQKQDPIHKTMAEIDYRVCQLQFKQCLLTAYEGKCAITGCDVSHALNAAHIVPYMGDITNDVKNGLLLRADINALFDSGKITVSSSDFRVILHRDLQNSQYGVLQGKMISVPKMKSAWPSKLALELHNKSSGL